MDMFVIQEKWSSPNVRQDPNISIDVICLYSMVNIEEMLINTVRVEVNGR